MYSLSKTSAKNLVTCDNRLITLVHAVLEVMDVSVLYGHRSTKEQFELFQVGRQLIDGHWIIVDKKEIKTYKDGITDLSKHNVKPSLAVDIAPYPIDWKDIERFKRMADVFLYKAQELRIKARWGGDFKDFKDYPHFELIG